jgi:hypothetical protein
MKTWFRIAERSLISTKIGYYTLYPCVLKEKLTEILSQVFFGNDSGVGAPGLRLVRLPINTTNYTDYTN